MKTLRISRKWRGALVLGAAALLVAVLPDLLRRLAPAPAAVEIAGLPGFVAQEAGAISARMDPFIGIPDPDNPRIEPTDVDAGQVCVALFPDDIPPDAVPVAMFTDVNCPHCRPMEGWLNDAGMDADIALRWHQLPLLGPQSMAAARAVAAADLQGAGDAMRTRLHRTRFAADPAYLTQVAGAMALDGRQLLADMDSPAVTAKIADSLGLVRLFGIVGTPALVVGRTLVVGAMSQPDFDALLRQEAADRAWPC